MDAQLSDRLPTFVDLLLDAVFTVDVSGRITYVSAACERIFGYTPDEMIGKALFDFLAPEERRRTSDEAVQVMSGRPRIGFENRYVRKNGSPVNIMWSARWSEADQLRIGVARDVTALKRAEALQTATYAISEAAHAASDLSALFEEVERIVATLVPVAEFAIALRDDESGRVNIVFQRNADCDTSLEQDKITQQVCAKVIRSRQPKPLPKWHGDADESRLAIPLVSHKRATGALIVKSHAGTIYSGQDKELLQYVSTQIATAIERKQLYADLQRMAQYDELTGLPNRHLFHDRMKIALARARREREPAAVLFIDVDNFKQVNDSLGHTAGDRLLQEVAERLQRSVREEDTVARLGGDEFVVLLAHMQTPDDASIVADKIRMSVGQPVHIENSVVSVSPSIGIALYPDDGTTADQLLKTADEAMYSAKKRKNIAAG